MKVNLKEADLTGAVLAGANLCQASLDQAVLLGARMQRANLRYARLVGAVLRGADLTGANLYRAAITAGSLADATVIKADFTESNLTATDLAGADAREAQFAGATLRRTDLRHANLSHAHLCQAFIMGSYVAAADFTEAWVGETIFADMDLSDVKGLESVQHKAPSTVDIATIYRSKASIPDTFLRGAGVPQNFMTFMASLTVAPVEFYSCFISYSSADHAFAERLHADLQAHGVRCWFAPEDMKIGDRMRTKIDDTIKVYDKLLLILSTTSVQSQWVEHEVEAALAKERGSGTTVLFPIRIDDSVMTVESG